MTKFVADNSLTMKGVNFYRGMFDRFTAYQLIHTSKVKPELVCPKLDEEIKFEGGKPMCVGKNNSN